MIAWAEEYIKWLNVVLIIISFNGAYLLVRQLRKSRSLISFTHLHSALHLCRLLHGDSRSRIEVGITVLQTRVMEICKVINYIICKVIGGEAYGFRPTA